MNTSGFLSRNSAAGLASLLLLHGALLAVRATAPPQASCDVESLQSLINMCDECEMACGEQGNSCFFDPLCLSLPGIGCNAMGLRGCRECEFGRADEIICRLCPWNVDDCIPNPEAAPPTPAPSQTPAPIVPGPSVLAPSPTPTGAPSFMSVTSLATEDGESGDPADGEETPSMAPFVSSAPFQTAGYFSSGAPTASPFGSGGGEWFSTGAPTASPMDWTFSTFPTGAPTASREMMFATHTQQEEDPAVPSPTPAPFLGPLPPPS